MDELPDLSAPEMRAMTGFNRDNLEPQPTDDRQHLEGTSAEGTNTFFAGSSRGMTISGMSTLNYGSLQPALAQQCHQAGGHIIRAYMLPNSCCDK